MRERNKIIAAFILVMLAGGIFGYMIGTYTTIKWVGDVVINYMDYKNISIVGISKAELLDYAYKFMSLAR